MLNYPLGGTNISCGKQIKIFLKFQLFYIQISSQYENPKEVLKIRHWIVLKMEKRGRNYGENYKI